MGLTMFEIYDNFLERDYFDSLVRHINDRIFTWKYCDFVAKKSDDTEISQEQSEEQFYFVHNIYEKDQPCSELYEYTKPLYGKLKVLSLIRSRVIMYMNQGKQIIHEKHTDFDYDHTAVLLYLNTNNGFTEFSDGSKCESIENRLVVFNGSIEHNSSTCTDVKKRQVLTINYF
tara:strand:- start:359 stop:877 length:519 start_codon:yes stop_codon:yes gene_type:complete